MVGFKVMESSTWPLWMQIIGVIASVAMIAIMVIVSRSKQD